jgi:hypothetical protein
MRLALLFMAGQNFVAHRYGKHRTMKAGFLKAKKEPYGIAFTTCFAWGVLEGIVIWGPLNEKTARNQEITAGE